MQITPHAGGGVNEAEQPYESPGGLLHRRFAIDRSGDCLVIVDCVIWRFDGAQTVDWWLAPRRGTPIRDRHSQLI